jgi:hypothetical protein
MGYVVERALFGQKILKEEIFCFDSIFSVLLGNSDIDVNFVRSLPFIEDMINDYTKLLDNHYKLFTEEFSRLSNLFKQGEIYERRINLHGKDSYYMMFSIPALLKVIEKFNLKPKPIATRAMFETIHMEGLNDENLKDNSNIDVPILVANYLITKPHYFIIDGNHRVVKNLKKGNEAILGYVFDPGHFVEGVASEIYKYIYYVHYNIYIISNYMKGLEGFDINKDLFPLVNDKY